MPASLGIQGDVIARRLQQARAGLRACQFCELRCGADRIAGERAPCRLGADSFVFRRSVSLSDEAEVVPTLRVYLGGCNFRCRFCNTAPGCFEPVTGTRVDVASLARELGEALRKGVRTISFLGGEPTLHVHTLLEIAEAAASPLPIVLNTNMYMTPQVLEWLDGVVTCFSADFKFGNDDCARALAGMGRYTEVVTRNLLAVAGGGAKLIVRHLLMPGHWECCFRPVADWVGAHLPGIRFQLSPGYVPSWKAAHDTRLGRLNDAAEVDAARDYLSRLPLQTSPSSAPAEDVTSCAVGEHSPVTITLGVDGRVYWHELTPDLLPIAAALSPQEPELVTRIAGERSRT